MRAKAHRLVRAPVTVIHWMACARQTGAPLPEVSVPEGIVTRIAVPADFPRIAALTQSPGYTGRPLRPEDLESRVARGDVCFIAEAGGRIVYTTWTRFDRAPLAAEGIDVPLLPGEAYVGLSFAAAEFRRQGIATAVGVARLRWLRQRGVTNLYTWVNTANRPAVGALARTGWRVVGEVRQVRWRAGINTSLLNLVLLPDASDPLAQWCSPHRLRFRAGVTIFRQRRQGPGREPRETEGGGRQR